MTENIVNEEQIVEKVELTAGEMLRNARTTGRRKREISTIAKQLCIREEFLQALEEGNYTFIPETVYILGFARNYAMELGLNPDEIVAKIKQEMGLVPGACATNPDVADEDGPTCARPSIKEDNPGKALFVKVYQFVYQNWIWFVGAIVAIALIVAGILFLGGDKEEAKVQEPAPVIAIEPEIVEVSYNLPVRERFGTENREDAVVVLQANDKVGVAGAFVKVKDARGRVVFSRALVPGDVYYVPNSDKMSAVFGKANGIDIWVNGVQVPNTATDHKDVSLSPQALIQGK